MASSARSTGGGSRSAATRKTARPGRTAAQKRARRNREAAAARRKTAGKDVGTEGPGSGRRSVADHSEHPESRADSTVAHDEPQTGKRSAGAGEGGFPQGEGDVVKPALEGEDKRSVKEQLLDAHFGTVDIRRHLADADKKGRLDRTTVTVATETLPVGAIVEHEAENRWRIRVPTGGGNRYGFGATYREAIESYVLGDAVVDEQSAAAKRFSELSPRQQEEIRVRDEKAARRVGQDPTATPEAIARNEAAENAKAENKALGNKKARTGQITEGAERASARDLAGQKRGAREEIAAYDTGSSARSSQARGTPRSSQGSDRTGAGRSQGSTRSGSSASTGKSGGKGAASAGNNSRGGSKK